MQIHSINRTNTKLRESIISILYISELIKAIIGTVALLGFTLLFLHVLWRIGFLSEALQLFASITGFSF